jgi:hypothetical protein
VSFLAVTKVTFCASEEPKTTVDEELKFLPVIVTTVDPVVGPDVGDTFVTVGPTGPLNVQLDAIDG